MKKLSTFQKLPFYEKYFDDPIDGIPKKSGVYYWVYWPTIKKNISVQDLEKRLLEYSKSNLLFSEKMKGVYKFQAIISEQWYRDNGNVFGLSDDKKDKLLDYLKSDQKNLDFFLDYFERVCFSRPFYIGKANNLRSRLVNNHFKGKSEILKQINLCKIPTTDIHLGFELTNDDATEKVNVIFEEIFSRRIKPGLTKKPN